MLRRGGGKITLKNSVDFPIFFIPCFLLNILMIKISERFNLCFFFAVS